MNRTIEDALTVAVDAHRGQLYPAPEPEPFIHHPLRVMLGVTSRTARIVALLHDVVEDSPLTLGDLADKGFDQSVLDAVDCLSRRPDEPYAHYINRVATDRLAREVKRSDLADNLANNRALPATSDNLARIERYVQALRVLNETSNSCTADDRGSDSVCASPEANDAEGANEHPHDALNEVPVAGSDEADRGEDCADTDDQARYQRHDDIGHGPSLSPGRARSAGSDLLRQRTEGSDGPRRGISRRLRTGSRSHRKGAPMTTNPTAAKNLDLAFEVAFQVLAEPKVVDEVMALAGEGTLVLYDDADEELTIANDQMADRLQKRGQPVVRVALTRRTTLNRR